MIPRPARGLLFLALALVLVIPPAIAGRGGAEVEEEGAAAEAEGAAVAEWPVAAVAECRVAAVAECRVAAVEVGASLGAQG